MNLEQAHYILKYYDNLMTFHEKTAWKHWVINYKIEHSGSTQSQKEAKINLYLKNGRLSSEPTIKELLKNGIDYFIIKTAKRISLDHPKVLKLNNCAKCGKLARTPFAKQCRYCFHDWH